MYAGPPKILNRSKLMTLADAYTAASGKYGIFSAKLESIQSHVNNWQVLRIISNGVGYDLSVWADPDLPELWIKDSDVGKEFEFRIKIRRSGNFTNAMGHINGPAQEH